jgi:hypothetical protein
MICIGVFSLNAQINVKKLKEKAKSAVQTETKQATQEAKSVDNPSSGSVWDKKKVNIEKLEEKPEGTIQDLNLFYGAGYEFMKNTVGLVMSSPDGINWKKELESKSISITDVAYGEGKIVAVGGTTVFFTTDGTDWKSVEGTINGALNGTYNGVAYGSGMFVAVGSTATIAFSKDGETWVKYFGEDIDPEFTAGVTHFYGVTYAEGKFYIMGNANRIASLTPDPVDGLIKEKCNTLGMITDRFNDMAYGNGSFIVVGTKDDYVSADGLNWNITKPEWQIWGIGYGNGLFVKACGFGRIFTSPDGADNKWTEAFQMSRTLFWDACYGNDKWIVTGKDGAVLTSSDGKEWEYHSTQPKYSVLSLVFVD